MEDIEVKPHMETNRSAIIGEVVIGKTDPRNITKEVFNESEEILFHGAAKEFEYSATGEYDVFDTGGDGSTDYGFGFYTTDNLKQAENYSRVRGNRKEPLTYNFLPYNAKMLDVRDKNNPNHNGILPKEFVKKWLKFLEKDLEEEVKRNDMGDFAKEAQREGVTDFFIKNVKKHLEKESSFIIRNEFEEPGIFLPNYNGLIDLIFQRYMESEGFDGMIFVEGGEGDNKEKLTGYVFYNPEVIDTWEGWQKRKSK